MNEARGGFCFKSVRLLGFMCFLGLVIMRRRECCLNLTSFEVMLMGFNSKQGRNVDALESENR